MEQKSRVSAGISPEPSDAHEGAVEVQQGAGLDHVLFPQARVPPGAAPTPAPGGVALAVVGHVGAAGARQDGHQLQEQLPAHLPQHRAALALPLGGRGRRKEEEKMMDIHGERRARERERERERDQSEELGERE